MDKTFNLLFYIKKSKKNSLGKSPIYMRITIDGRRIEISAKRVVQGLKWNSIAQKVNGVSEDVKALNFYLKTLEQKVYDAYHQLLRENEEVNCEILKNKLLEQNKSHVLSYLSFRIIMTVWRN